MKTKEIKREGFWYSPNDSYNKTLPKPKPNLKAWKGKWKFIQRLISIELLAKRDHYKGFSYCRICDVRNGSKEYEYKGWRWPEGYLHYVKEHNVVPSLEFQKAVESWAKEWGHKDG